MPDVLPSPDRAGGVASALAVRLRCTEGQLYTMVVAVALVLLVSVGGLPEVVWRTSAATARAAAPASASLPPDPSLPAPPVAPAFDGGSGLGPSTSSPLPPGPPETGAAPGDGWAPSGEPPTPPEEPPQECAAAPLLSALESIVPDATPARDVVDQIAAAAGCSRAATSLAMLRLAVAVTDTVSVLPAAPPVGLLRAPVRTATCDLVRSTLAALAGAYAPVLPPGLVRAADVMCTGS